MALNIGAKAARGEFLLFLNNDAALGPGSIEHLLETARRSSSIGAVGGKLVYPDGRLQEAGSIIWSDGSCEGYGRGGDPAAPEYNFERPVDFCSAALLLTPRVALRTARRLRRAVSPGVLRGRRLLCRASGKSGHSVVYQPKAAAIHYEFGSHPRREASGAAARAPADLRLRSHASWLASQLSDGGSVLKARSHPHGQPSVLVIDDAVPDPRMGAGFPRAAALAADA